MKIKVLHLISGNDNGGAGNAVLNLCAFKGNNFENFLGCVGSGPLYEKAVKQDINVVLFQGLRKINKAVINDIINFSRDNSIDIINFHGPTPNVIHLFIRKRADLKCITTVHSDYRFDFLNNKIKYLLFTPINKFALKKFQGYVCVSDSIKKLLDEKGFKGQKFVIRNGININPDKVIESSMEIKERYGIGEDDFVFINVARMHPVKNHIGLINAFKKLNSEFKNVKLILVGDGELKDSLKKEVQKSGIEKSVIFTGFKHNPLDYVNFADISIITSFNEGGSPPLAILESGIMKKTAICSNIGDIGTILGGELVFLADPTCTDDIYTKMKEAYFNKDSLESMGNALYEYVLKNHSLEKYYRRYYDSYMQLLNN